MAYSGLPLKVHITERLPYIQEAPLFPQSFNGESYIKHYRHAWVHVGVVYDPWAQ